MILQSGYTLRLGFRRQYWVLPALLFLLFSCSGKRAIDSPVKEVDMHRFLGEWYELAALRIEEKDPCTCYALAYQEMRRAGMRVVKRCRDRKGNWVYDKGKAWIIYKDGIAVLQSEYQWPLKGELYFLELDSNYRYAMLGNAGRTTLRILSRTKEMDPEIMEKLLDRAEAMGYDRSAIRPIPQNCIH